MIELARGSRIKVLFPGRVRHIRCVYTEQRVTLTDIITSRGFLGNSRPWRGQVRRVLPSQRDFDVSPDWCLFQLQPLCLYVQCDWHSTIYPSIHCGQWLTLKSTQCIASVNIFYDIKKNQTWVDKDKPRNLEFGLWTLDFFYELKMTQGYQLDHSLS